MKPVEIEVKVNIIKKELAYWESVLKDRRCVTCLNYSRPMGKQSVCKLAGITPPPEVLKTGCPEWDYDEIPF